MHTKNMQIVVILIVVVIAIIVVFGFFGIGGLSFFGSPTPAAQTPAEALLAQVRQTGSVPHLITEDATVGTGDPVAPGDTVTVNYVGALPDGTVFDSSSSHGTPFTFTVGAGQVIQGWEQGLVGMKDGGERLLAVPAAMGYGSQAVTDSSGKVVIPANSTLIFDIQLVKRMPAGATSTSAVLAPGTSTPAH